MNAPRLHLISGDGQGDRHAHPTPLWDVPVPLGAVAPPPPPFPVDVYPGWLADMVDGVARFTQTDIAMAGTVALAVLSACAGGRLEVEPVRGWREPVNLYLAVIADPGEMKSPVHGALTAPLEAVQAALKERLLPLREEHAALKDIAERQAEQAKAIAAKADPANRDQATADAVAAALAAEAITIPTLPRLMTDDATPEKLIGLMAANGGRMAIISDEGGIFDTLAGRYSGTPNLDPYLKGHSGKPHYYDRQGTEGAYIAKPALTVGVMAQPSVLRKFGGNADLFGRGLPARFLFALPKSLTGHRDFTHAPPLSDAIAETYGATVHDLAATFVEWTDPAVVALTGDATRIRNTAVQTIETQLRPGGNLHDMRSWANKLRGTMLRLAGLLHVAHRPTDGWRYPIDADRMADAVRLTAFFIEHYRAALACIIADEHAATVRYVLGVLVTKGMATFSRRELHRKVSRQLPKAAQVQAALDELAALGWVRPLDTGGYELHPRAGEYAASVDTLTNASDDHIPAGQPPDSGVNAPVDTPLTALTLADPGRPAVNGVNACQHPPLTGGNHP
jgi:replicative DNA helicase